MLAKRVVVKAVLTLLIATPLFASNPVLSRFFVIPKSPQSMRAIAEKFEVTHPIANGYEVIVPLERADEVIELSFDARMIEADISAKWHQMSARERAGWHNFETVQSELKQIAVDYPKLASVSEYGKSKEGRPLVALRLLSPIPLKKRVNRPQIVITGSTHGDELITVEVVLGILNSLVKGWGTDTRLTKIVDDHEIYFIPVVNPDGYVRQERYANGIDPNRDYPWPEKPNRNPNPCIKAIMDFFASHNIKGSLDYHSAASMIMYPWAYTYSAVSNADDEKYFHNLTKNMAEANGYEYGQISKIIYIATGSSADYYYWKHGTKALGIEISQNGPTNAIPSLIKENLESTYRFIEAFPAEWN